MVCAGKQRRNGNQLIGWLVVGVKRSIEVDFPRISTVEIVSSATDGASVKWGSSTVHEIKNPKRFGWVVLAWIDVDIELRLPPVVAKNPASASQNQPKAFR